MQVSPDRHAYSLAILTAFVLLLDLRLLLFSQTGAAFYGDEGMSLLAAWLIHAGRTPYFDFLCPHPPSYFYLVAWWMDAFGFSWRSAHALSAILSAGAVALVAAYVFSRLRESPWRLPASLVAAALMGLNPMVMWYGVIGQYYGLLLLLVTAAFWLTTAAAQRRPPFTVLPGLFTGAALSVSLLTAPVAPILFLWIASRAGQRRPRIGWFLAGMGIAFLPLLAMALRGFSYVFYNLFVYHTIYRRVGFWGHTDIGLWNLRMLWLWASSPWNIGAALLALAGGRFAAGPAGSSEERRWCAVLAIALGIFLMLPRPTFAQYFVLLTPFLAILGAFGAAGLGARFRIRPAAACSAGAVALFLMFWTARFVSKRQWHDFHSGEWIQLEEIAARVNRLTAAGAPLYANQDLVYFAARRIPPPGLENSYAREWDAPPRVARLLHFMPQERFNRWLAEGRYDTVVLLSESGEERQVDLAAIYSHKQTLGSYTIYWDRLPRPARLN